MTKGGEGRITDLVVGAAVVGLLAYETWTLVNRQEGDTISESIWRAAKRRPLIPFGFGALMGHLFWQKEESEVKVEINRVEVKP